MKFFSFLIIALFSLSGCSTPADLESGVIGRWRCIKVESEILKPNWISSDLGSNYKVIINGHTESTLNSTFTFGPPDENEMKMVSIIGQRNAYSTWKAIQATQTIDMSFTRVLSDEEKEDMYSQNTNDKVLRVSLSGRGFNRSLYDGMEVMSWNVKELDPNHQMLVEETLGNGSVVFTYYLECR